MKILFVASGTIWGGGSIALYNLIKELKYKGHEIYVLLPRKNGKLYNELKNIDVKIFSAHYGLSIKPNSRNIIVYISKYIHLLIKQFVGRITVMQIVKRIKPDIVHTNVGPLDIAHKVCIKKGIPHVWHIREYQRLDFSMFVFPSMMSFKKKLEHNNNHNIAITKGIFDYWNLDLHKDTIIYDGVFSKKIYEPVYNVKENYFLFVGRIEKAKGLFDLLIAFSKFKKITNDYKLLVAGSYANNNDYMAECKSFIDSHDLNESVIFLGERNDIYSLMSKAKALIVPSIYEGFGFITVEAMLNKCLVIGRNTGGTKEQLDRGEADLGCPIGIRFNSIDELYNCLIWAISNNYDEIIERAYKYVMENYSTERHADDVENYYYSILNEKLLLSIKN